MPRPRPLRLHKETNRHGTVVWYVRVGQGPRIRIKAKFGTPEFEAAYQSAVNGERPRTPGEAAHGTLGWLFDLYRQTSAWTDLAQSTRYKREQIIMRWFTDRRRRRPRPPACAQWRDQDRQRKNRDAGGNPDAGRAQGDDRGRADR